MTLADTLLAALALSSAGLWPSLLPAPAPAPDSPSIEVVFATARGAALCDGCHKTVTDSLANSPNPVYTCPNGDQWTLILGAPTSADGDCHFMLYLCDPRAACTFDRAAQLVYIDNPDNGSCDIYYRVDTMLGDYQAGNNGDDFTADLTAPCKGGSPAQEVCEERYIEFYDSTFDSNRVVFAWKTKICCTKCPD